LLIASPATCRPLIICGSSACWSRPPGQLAASQSECPSKRRRQNFCPAPITAPLKLIPATEASRALELVEDPEREALPPACRARHQPEEFTRHAPPPSAASPDRP